ncbi:MAG: hypothetical protein M0Z69_12155 [Actinomycetota bacterium]|nr:hypothetical protein [Actinomycetota bacterium]
METATTEAGAQARSLKRRNAAILSTTLACAAGGALAGTLAFHSTGGGIPAARTYPSRLAAASTRNALPDAPLPGRGAYGMVPGTRFPPMPRRSAVVGTLTGGGTPAKPGRHGSRSGGSTHLPGTSSPPATGAGTPTAGPATGRGSAPRRPTSATACIGLPKSLVSVLPSDALLRDLVVKDGGKDVTIQVGTSGARICGRLPKDLVTKLGKQLAALVDPGTSLPTLPPVTLPGGGGGLGPAQPREGGTCHPALEVRRGS